MVRGHGNATALRSWKLQSQKLGQPDAVVEELELEKVPINTFNPTNGKEVDSEGFYAAWAQSQGGKMMASSWSTLPVADRADKSRRGYHTTVTKTHAIEYAPCKRILEVHDAITQSPGNLELYFAVPD